MLARFHNINYVSKKFKKLLAPGGSTELSLFKLLLCDY